MLPRFQDCFPAANTEGLVNRTDPEHPAYWGPVAGCDQKIVEMAAIATTLMLCGERLASSEREARSLHAWLSGVEGKALPQNNWLFFWVLVQAAFRRMGCPLRTEPDLPLRPVRLFLRPGLRRGGSPALGRGEIPGAGQPAGLVRPTHFFLRLPAHRGVRLPQSVRGRELQRPRLPLLGSEGLPVPGPAGGTPLLAGGGGNPLPEPSALPAQGPDAHCPVRGAGPALPGGAELRVPAGAGGPQI